MPQHFLDLKLAVSFLNRSQDVWFWIRYHLFVLPQHHFHISGTPPPSFLPLPIIKGHFSPFIVLIP